MNHVRYEVSFQDQSPSTPRLLFSLRREAEDYIAAAGELGEAIPLSLWRVEGGCITKLEPRG